MKEALTEFSVLERFSDATLVEVVPKTGRMHQIRVHFAYIGHPVLGDRLYGGMLSVAKGRAERGGKAESRFGLQRQFLHARSLSFSYPEGRRFTFEASLPDDLRNPLILSAIEDMSSREVAEILNISEVTVRTRIHRARKLLREKIQKLVGRE